MNLLFAIDIIPSLLHHPSNLAPTLVSQKEFALGPKPEIGDRVNEVLFNQGVTKPLDLRFRDGLPRLPRR